MDSNKRIRLYYTMHDIEKGITELEKISQLIDGVDKLLLNSLSERMEKLLAGNEPQVNPYQSLLF